MAIYESAFLIPTLDRYLEKKYMDEFKDYSKKTYSGDLLAALALRWGFTE